VLALLFYLPMGSLFDAVWVTETSFLQAHPAAAGIILGILILGLLLLLVAVVVGLIKINREVGQDLIGSLFFFAAPSLVFEELGIKEAIKRGGGVSRWFFETFRFPSRDGIDRLFIKLLLVTIIVGMAEGWVVGYVPDWSYIISKPLIFAYGSTIWAVFFLSVWEKFGE
jgi:hypothetical protein